MTKQVKSSIKQEAKSQKYEEAKVPSHVSSRQDALSRVLNQLELSSSGLSQRDVLLSHALKTEREPLSLVDSLSCLMGEGTF